MLTSIISLDQTFNANDVDILVFEPSVLFPPPSQFGGGIDDRVRILYHRKKIDSLTPPISVYHSEAHKQYTDTSLIKLLNANHKPPNAVHRKR